MRLYLDACCLNRPFDDQSIVRNHLEAEAVLAILAAVARGEHALVASEVLDRELAANPDADKRAAAEELRQAATETLSVDASTARRAEELHGLGLPEIDAFHVSCAEAAACDVMLTTDDVLQRRYNRLRRRIRVTIANPLGWVSENLT